MNMRRSPPLHPPTPPPGKRQKREPETEWPTVDRALLDELLRSNETPSRNHRDRSGGDFSPSLFAGLAGDFSLEKGSFVAADLTPPVELAPETALKVAAALRAAFPEKDRFAIEFDVALGNSFTVEDPKHGIMAHHLDLRMESADGKDVYLAFLRAGPAVRGRDMLSRLDAFARDFGVRSIRLVDGAHITLIGTNGFGHEIEYSVVTILATGLSYYNHFGYSAVNDAKEDTMHNTALIDMPFKSALEAATDFLTPADAISEAVEFVDDNSDAFFGGHRAAESTARQIFAHLLNSGALKRGGTVHNLANWIADTVQLFSNSKRGIRVPSPVIKTSFAGEAAAVAAPTAVGGRRRVRARARRSWTRRSRTRRTRTRRSRTTQQRVRRRRSERSSA